MGAWSLDGRWVYLTVQTSHGTHLWRQRFPDGTPEQITSGPTEEDGLAIAPDGRSIITSVGTEQSSLWLHDGSGERQISLEGYASHPVFSPDMRRLYFLTSRSGSRLAGNLWVAELDGSRNEVVLPGVAVSAGFHGGFSLSPDGKRAVFTVREADGKPRLWLAALDRRSAPRPIPSAEGSEPHFASSGEIYFRVTEGASSYVYRIREDGSGRVKVLADPIGELTGMSPDGRWASVWAPAGQGESTTDHWLFPLAGGPPIPVPGAVSWSHDGRHVLVTRGGQVHGVRTVVVPVPSGKAFPDGLRAETDESALPGAVVISSPWVVIGSSPGVYVYRKVAVQRNLFRIPLQ